MTVDQVYSLVTFWAKRLIALGLLAFFVITVAKLFGVDLYPVQGAGMQETGVFLAGAAFALSKL